MPEPLLGLGGALALVAGGGALIYQIKADPGRVGWRAFWAVIGSLLIAVGLVALGALVLGLSDELRQTPASGVIVALVAGVLLSAAVIETTGMRAPLIDGAKRVRLRWPVAIMPNGSGSIRGVEAEARPTREELAERLTKYSRAAKGLVTWLYRRDEYPGLSDDLGKRVEAAPWSEYAAARFQEFGLGDEPYERTLDIPPEPWHSPSPWYADMLELHGEGQAIIDELSGSRDAGDYERKLIEDRFAQWDRRCREAVTARFGIGKWGSFENHDGRLMDDGALHYALDGQGFPVWVPLLANRVAARMGRLRSLTFAKGTLL